MSKSSDAQKRISELETECQQLRNQLTHASTAAGERHQKLFGDVADAISALLVTKDLEQAINKALTIIGKTTGSDRVYLFECHTLKTKTGLYYTQRFEWCAENVIPQIDNEALVNFPADAGLIRWHNELRQGRTIMGTVDEFPEAERTYLEAQGIKSLITTPVFIKDEYWGFAGFDNCSTKHTWSKTEQSVLQVLAACIGGSIYHHETEYKLVEARKQAEAGNNAKAEFLAVMSHETRTPLNAIRGFTDLLLNNIYQKEHREYLQNIISSTDSLLEIVESILDFSKAETGRLELTQSKFSIISLIAEVLSQFHNKAQLKNLKLTIKFDPNLPQTVISDPIRLKQIFINLIDNALKFTDQGGVTVDVSVFSIYEDTAKIQCVVEDTGCGITEENLKLLFRSFTMLDSSNTRRYGGIGLGLAIVNSIIEKMGGEIDVQSKIGKGSRFIITLPVKVVPENKTMASDISAASIDDVERLKVRKLLLVEDNEMNQKITVIVIKKQGWEIDVASNGQEAVEMLRDNDYALVLMDLQMPVMDGLRATAYIRDPQSNVRNHKIPILALSADAYPETKQKAFEAGVNDYITKPFNKQELFEKIAQLSGL
ncbi:MAG TPA: ATP-binding protein [Bacteroidales bacterium]|nr:ATP-binding protein [Bacteroidales bacterium]